MKKLNDDDIQRMFEQGLIKPNDIKKEAQEDIDAYDMLFNALNEQPDIDIPHNFALTTALIIKAKSKRSNLIIYYVLLFFILTMSVLAAYVLLLAFNRAAAIRISTIVAPYRWILLFIFFIFLTIQYIDQKFVKDPKGLV